MIERDREEVFGYSLRLPLCLNEKETKLSGIASAAAVVEREETKLSGIASAAAVAERERVEVVGHSLRCSLC